jgi:membrane protein DedA with SNARE-associated domain
MGLESSFIPFPSEVIVPPAGYLTVHGNMNIVLVIFSGIFGSLLGASVNYFIAYRYGRSFLLKYGKYLFLPEERFNKIDLFFSNHGEITTLIGRMIPVVRQYISFPAGLAKMNFFKFLFYTGLGASIWVIILAFVGRAVGNNIDLVKEHLHKITLVSIPIMIALALGYIIISRYFSGRKDKKEAVG